MKLLHRLNKWWDNSLNNRISNYPLTRKEFREIVDLLNERRILALVGPRRVGKSTLIYQTIQYLLKKKIDPKRILFFNADAPGLWLEAKNIDDIVEYYTVNILSESIDDLTEKIYVFIDEIHSIKNWQLYLKSMYDLDYNIKFIVSGSSASHMFKDSKESLLGRIDDLNIMPFDFSEFIRFSNHLRSEKAVEIPEIYGFDIKSPEKGFAYLKDNQGKISFYGPAINKVLKEYLLCGGYPEYFSSDNLVLWQKRLSEDILDRGLYRDIVAIYGIRQPAILEQLVYFIAANQGQAFSYTSLGNDLKTETSTIIQYVTYLCQSKIIRTVEYYSKSIPTIKKKNRKLYICDNGVRNAILSEDNISPDTEGHLVENCCASLFGRLSSKRRYGLYYWKNGQGEVDFIIDLKSHVLPVEIKYRNQIKQRELKGLTAFMEKNIMNAGLVVTRNTLAKDSGIYKVPFWMLALALKNDV